MSLQMASEYDDEERELLRRAVTEANRALEQLYKGSGRKYCVAYIELGAQVYDEDLEAMVIEPNHFIAADLRD